MAVHSNEGRQSQVHEEGGAVSIVHVAGPGIPPGAAAVEGRPRCPLRIERTLHQALGTCPWSLPLAPEDSFGVGRIVSASVAVPACERVPQRLKRRRARERAIRCPRGGCPWSARGSPRWARATSLIFWPHLNRRPSPISPLRPPSELPAPRDSQCPASSRHRACEPWRHSGRGFRCPPRRDIEFACQGRRLAVGQMHGSVIAEGLPNTL